MNRTKQNNLKMRVQAAYAEKRSQIRDYHYGDDKDMPPKLVKAVREMKRLDSMVDRWRKAKQKESGARYKRLEDGRRSVETMILFGTDAQALAAVKKFEALTV